MPPPVLSPHDADFAQKEPGDSTKRPSEREELRQNLAQLKIGDECLRRKRLLGGLGGQDYETYSLPVSRLPSMHDDSTDPSNLVTPVETPGTSRVPTRESQSSVSVPTKSLSPQPSTSAPGQPPALTKVASRDSVDDRPHQVKFILSDTPTEESPPPTPAEPPTPTADTTSAPRPQSIPDPNDPYRRSRRKPQTTNLAEIPDRFHFEKVTKKRQSQQLHYFEAPSSATAGPHHHHGGLLHNLSSKSLKDHFKEKSGHESSGGEELHDDHHSSQVSLRRFFKGGDKKKSASRPTTPISPQEPPKRVATPPPVKKRSPEKKPTHSTGPFGDDHAGLGLTERYGKFGKVLGAGAGGSVRLMKRASDGTTFAVKEFRPRAEHETQREYAKKVNAEFTIGSILSHQNIVETLDIVNEGGRYFEVMEYCRYDLFAIVMTGKQTEEEIGCCFKQICAGVRYLHEMGVAHRDLKLDNCVVNEFGIVKIIDFGCAVVFKYPLEQDIILATGIVGSDPYLAPEVCTEIRYDPQPADIWSLAIIYCCMTMRRFPWKAPRMSDPSFKNFASAPNPFSPDSSRSTSTSVSRKSTLDSAATLTNTDSQMNASGNNIAPTNSGNSFKKPSNQAGGPPPLNKGPMKLLNRLTPPQCRPLIGRMLDLNPKTRALMDEVWADPWFIGLKRCEMVTERLEDGGKRMVVKRAGTHTHVLVGPNGEDVTPSGTSIKRISAQQSHKSGR